MVLVLASNLRDAGSFSKAALDLLDQEVLPHEASELGLPHLPPSASLGLVSAGLLLAVQWEKDIYQPDRRVSLVLLSLQSGTGVQYMLVH